MVAHGPCAITLPLHHSGSRLYKPRDAVHIQRQPVAGVCSADIVVGPFDVIPFLAMPCCRNEKNADDAAIPWGAFPIGSVAGGVANEREEYGLTVDLAADRNVVGLVCAEQVPSPLPAVARDECASQEQSVEAPWSPHAATHCGVHARRTAARGLATTCRAGSLRPRLLGGRLLQALVCSAAAWQGLPARWHCAATIRKQP